MSSLRVKSFLPLGFSRATNPPCESKAVACELDPGEASFHHGWTLHSSLPNASGERRIGFNAQYIATHMRQTQHDRDTALLVCGVDDYGHFGKDIAAETDLEPEAVEASARPRPHGSRDDGPRLR